MDNFIAFIIRAKTLVDVGHENPLEIRAIAKLRKTSEITYSWSKPRAQAKQINNAILAYPV